MKRILGGLIFVFVFGAAGLCADPPGQVDIVPLVDFEGVIDDVRQFFTDVLKEQWVVLLSFFFVWLSVRYGRAMLDGRFKEIKAEVDYCEHISAAVDKIENTKNIQLRNVDSDDGFENLGIEDRDAQIAQRGLKCRMNLELEGCERDW